MLSFYVHYFLFMTEPVGSSGRGPTHRKREIVQENTQAVLSQAPDCAMLSYLASFPSYPTLDIFLGLKS